MLPNAKALSGWNDGISSKVFATVFSLNREGWLGVTRGSSFSGQARRARRRALCHDSPRWDQCQLPAAGRARRRATHSPVNSPHDRPPRHPHPPFKLWCQRRFRSPPPTPPPPNARTAVGGDDIKDTRFNQYHTSTMQASQPDQKTIRPTRQLIGGKRPLIIPAHHLLVHLLASSHTITLTDCFGTSSSRPRPSRLFPRPAVAGRVGLDGTPRCADENADTRHPPPPRSPRAGASTCTSGPGRRTGQQDRTATIL